MGPSRRPPKDDNDPESRREQAWWNRAFKLAALVIAAYETFFDRTDRPSLLLFAAALAGLTQFLPGSGR